MVGCLYGHVQFAQKRGADELQGQDVGRAVAEQALSGFLILVLLPAEPEVYGFCAVYTVEIIRAHDVQGVFDFFEATPVLLVVALPAQINVGAREFRDVVGAQHEGDIKAGAVKGHEQIDLFEQVQKVIEVFAVDKGVYLAPMIAGHARDIGVIREAAGFNVKVRETIKVGGQDSPLFPGGQMINEELNVTLLQGSLALGEYFAQGRGRLGAKRQIVWFFQYGLPVGVAACLDLGLSRWANARGVQEGSLQFG